jgi:hypothetical protein
MDTYTNKYKTTLEACREMLDEYGVAVISRVLNTETCNEIVDELWNNLESTTSMYDRNNTETGC